MGDQLPLPLLPLAGLLPELEPVGLQEAPLLLGLPVQVQVRVALGTVRGPRSDQPLVELVAPSRRSGRGEHQAQVGAVAERP